MKTTIANIINSDKALSNLLEQKLPLGISIQLGKVVQELEPVYKKANEARLEIFKKHGEEVLKDGQPSGEYQIKPEKFKAFEAEMKETFESEIELSIASIDPERLPEVCLTGKDAIALSWLWKWHNLPEGKAQFRAEGQEIIMSIEEPVVLPPKEKKV